MGWDKGRYYTRSRKVNGRVVREYVGTGEVAEMAAEIDALGREGRALAAIQRRLDRAELDDLDDDVLALIDITDLLARAALAAAGYGQHHRGEWRKKRVRKDPGQANDPADDGRSAGVPEARPGG
jgi:hypothetical protein